MTKSTRLKATTIATRAEFDRVVDDLARSAVSLRKLTAARDNRIQLIRQEWSPQIEETLVRIENLTLLAEKYAEANRAELLPDETKPGGRKSAETPLAVFGWRLGNQVLVTARKITWAKVLAELIRRRFKGWIRVKREPAKEVMLAAAKRSKKAVAILAELGVTVAQEESFYVDPKDQPKEQPSKAA